MEKSKKRNYIKDISKIVINKVRTNVRGYISSIIIGLINTWINKLASSKNTIFDRHTNDICFLILSAMILFTYYHLHKH
ncbi:transposase [Clostridium sp. Marseille-Q2269]|uniref:transposase n=1 Tax=Clostridium sp. Marseille-Q2269 TaxID=2942205 RepID=UPI002073A2B1|nr:transposase [Clostridium sp. Marseille-Q2269]